MAVSMALSALPLLPPPHILFFMADDTGWNNVEWHDTGEGAGMRTPHAHALLKEGIELDRHCACAAVPFARPTPFARMGVRTNTLPSHTDVYAVCSPSRSSFMTGRFPYHVTQTNRKNCDLGQGVPRNMTFIARKLKEAPASYATVHVGKCTK